jgi:hypothetical protein
MRKQTTGSEPRKTGQQAQSDFVERCRRESCVDPAIPLGFAPAPAPEAGPTAAAYFAAKHRRGDFGRFYPAHTLAAWGTKQFRAAKDFENA